MSDLAFRAFDEKDEPAVIDLWARCDLLRPWNDPRKDIARKLKLQRELILVAEQDRALVGTIMAGHEGHRGWINYLAVHPELQRRGIGRALMAEAEARLRALGCPKINLQIRRENAQAIAFYERLGFVEDASLSFGLRLERDDG